MNLPSFDSFFSSIEFYARTVGLIILKPAHNWTKIDWFLSLFGYLNIFIHIYNVVISAIQIIQFVHNELYIAAIGTIPGIFWAMSSSLNMVTLVYCKENLRKIVKRFSELYDTNYEINTDKYNQELCQDKKKAMNYLMFFVVMNIVFSLSPITIVILKYLTTGVYEPEYMNPIMWYPFDRVKYYWFVYLFDFVMARVSAFGGITPDILLFMFIVQMVYHFNCFGNQIQTFVVEKPTLDFIKLKKLVEHHQNLIR